MKNPLDNGGGDGLPSDTGEQAEMAFSPAGPALYDTFLDAGIVVLDGPIDARMSDRVCQQLLMLSLSGAREIQLFVRSPGGSADAGLAIFDMMRYVGSNVSTLAAGAVASVGQILVSGGAAGRRRALAQARLKLPGDLEGIETSAADPAVRADQLLHTRRAMLERTADVAGKPLAAICADGDLERWFTAEEAAAYGLVDTVVPQRGPVAESGHLPS